MAEAASGAGGTSLEGERGKRPPPEGEPAAPASGVLGRCAATGFVRVAGVCNADGGWTGTGIGVSCSQPGAQSRGWLLPTLRLGKRRRDGAASGGPRAEIRTRPSQSPGSWQSPVTLWATGSRLGRGALESSSPQREQNHRVLGSNPSSAV